MDLFMVVYILVDGQVEENFLCHAEDKEHAMEQCDNAYPTSVVLRVYQLVEV